MADHKNEIILAQTELWGPSYSFPTGNKHLNYISLVLQTSIFSTVFSLFSTNMETEADMAVICLLKHNYRHIYSCV